MTTENPTHLRLGMKATFFGKSYRLAGRVVLGETEHLAVYYWNEFYLESDTGDMLTLVFEQTQRGDEWRLFTMYDPEIPMSVEDAESKRVGDFADLRGTNLCVTFRNTSRVYLVEGRAPDWIKVGCKANYFNAESGQTMEVVSWTGDQLEFYHGNTLTRGMVKAAFNLTGEPSVPSLRTTWQLNEENTSKNFLTIIWVALILFFAVIAFQDFSCSNRYEAKPAELVAAGPAPIAVGRTGHLAAGTFQIAGHAVVDFATVEKVVQQHEYELINENGRTNLLVCDVRSKQWMLFAPLVFDSPPAAQACATYVAGSEVRLDGMTAKVQELFRSTVRQTDGSFTNEVQLDAVRYGFLAKAPDALIVARWDGNHIYFYRGTNLSAKEVVSAFSGH